MTGGAQETPRATWPFPTAAAMGSGVRAEFIEREVRKRLKVAMRPLFGRIGDDLVLILEPGMEELFEASVPLVAAAVAEAATFPVTPSEVEDILGIIPRERLKWTADGRLASAGTRTVRFPGRSRKVTYHVHDPRLVEEVRDLDLPTIWREEDKAAAAENRRMAAGRAAATRAAGARSAKTARRTPDAADLAGWAEFADLGILG